MKVEDAFESPHLVSAEVFPEVVELYALPDAFGPHSSGYFSKVFAVSHQRVVKHVNFFVRPVG